MDKRQIKSIQQNLDYLSTISKLEWEVNINTKEKTVEYWAVDHLVTYKILQFISGNQFTGYLWDNRNLPALIIGSYTSFSLENLYTTLSSQHKFLTQQPYTNINPNPEEYKPTEVLILDEPNWTSIYDRVLYMRNILAMVNTIQTVKCLFNGTPLIVNRKDSFEEVYNNWASLRESIQNSK